MLNYFLINFLIHLFTLFKIIIMFIIPFKCIFSSYFGLIHSFTYLFIYCHISPSLSKGGTFCFQMYFFFNFEIGNYFQIHFKTYCFHSFVLFFNFIIYFFMHLELRHLCNPFENKSKLRVFSHMYSIS